MAALDTSPPEPGPIGRWVLAARPRTLPLAVAPVAVGTALAAAHGSALALPALAAALGALLLQVGANLANDVFDFEKGADTDARLGPPRVTQLGWLTPTAMRRGTAVAFGAALLPGLYLSWVGGWPIVAVGAASVAAGLAYTGGPYPLGYHGLGDAAVFLFFGVVAVCGSYWVQAGTLSLDVLGTSALLGALATVPLAVNNLRDVATDAPAGKRTLAVRFGPNAARAEIVLLVAGAYTGCVLLAAFATAPPTSLLPLASLPLAVRLLRRIRRAEGSELNDLVGESARLTLVFALLLSAGWLV